MRLRAGTSGFSYKEWKGPFYPEKLPAKEMLGYYAEQLSTVEINNTFYRMPKPGMLEGWAEKVPDDFVFVLKAAEWKKLSRKTFLAEMTRLGIVPENADFGRAAERIRKRFGADFADRFLRLAGASEWSTS